MKIYSRIQDPLSAKRAFLESISKQCFKNLPHFPKRILLDYYLGANSKTFFNALLPGFR